MSHQRQDVFYKFIVSRLVKLFILTISILALSRAEANEPSTPKTVGTFSSVALREMVSGNFIGATQPLRQAQALSPDDMLLQTMIGALSIDTCDFHGANEAFNRVLSVDRSDPLALYGRGLCKISQGKNLDSIVDFDLSEKNGGDRAVLLIARRYAQWLSGASVSIENAGLPESLKSGQLALEGMQWIRRGDLHKGSALLENALSGLTGDAILQPVGPLMTFNAKAGLDSGGRRLSVDSLSSGTPDKETLRGRVEISPNSEIDGVSYVAYDLDAQPLGIVNTYPFKYVFDTSRVSNGLHNLNVILYDRSVTEIRRTSKKVRVSNAVVELSAEEAEVQLNARVQLWQMLSLKPDRRQASYLIGRNSRETGRLSEAKSWFLRTLALQEDYSDARRQWISCGGITGSGEAIWGGLTNRKLVALTFDDGPKPGVTEPLLEILKDEGAIGTFFVIGKHVSEYPELTKQISDAGMEIANHSYTHPNLTKISSQRVAQEMLQTQAAVLKVTGKTPRYARPPGGNWNANVAKSVRSWGLVPCMWTVDVYGSEVLGAQQVANAVLSQVKPGSIILMHNGKVSTLQALPTIIRELKKRGYAFVTVDTMVQNLNASKGISPQKSVEFQKIE